MSYDPRPITGGGNRGIDISFSRQAPKNKFRVVGIDTFSGDDWLEKDFDTLEEAKKFIQKKTIGKQMLFMNIYDDEGNFLCEEGQW